MNRRAQPRNGLNSQRFRRILDQNAGPELVLSLILGTAFWYETTKAFERSCFGYSLFWAYYAKYFYFSTAIVSFAILVFFKVDLYKDHIQKTSPKILQVIHVLIRIFGIPLIFGAVVSYISSDECPDLGTITTIHFILMLCVLAIASFPIWGCFCCCACCCCFCLFGHLADGCKKRMGNNHQPRHMPRPRPIHPQQQQPGQANNRKIDLGHHLLPM